MKIQLRKLKYKIIMKIQLQKLKYVTNPGQNGQIPQFLEIFSKKTLFRK